MGEHVNLANELRDVKTTYHLAIVDCDYYKTTNREFNECKGIYIYDVRDISINYKPNDLTIWLSYRVTPQASVIYRGLQEVREIMGIYD
jgi:hypothetical protein